MNDFNYERLRQDLLEYYSTAAGMGFSKKLVEYDLKRVSEADEKELLEIAAEEEFDTEGYK